MKWKAILEVDKLIGCELLGRVDHEASLWTKCSDDMLAIIILTMCRQGVQVDCVYPCKIFIFKELHQILSFVFAGGGDSRPCLMAAPLTWICSLANGGLLDRVFCDYHADSVHLRARPFLILSNPLAGIRVDSITRTACLAGVEGVLCITKHSLVWLNALHRLVFRTTRLYDWDDTEIAFEYPLALVRESLMLPLIVILNLAFVSGT